MRNIIMKILPAAGILVLAAFVLTGCGKHINDTWDAYHDQIDTGYATEVAQHIGDLGDDPATGQRGAGGDAEKQAAEYLAGQLEKLGVEKVTTEPFTCDTWVYKGANITYTNVDGEEKTVDLGGYQTTLQCTEKKVDIVYLGKGTEADYEGVDVKGKLVLIDINQDEDWWINYPSYEAKVHGALGVVACTKMTDDNGSRIGSQDICGPDDAPAFAISQNASKNLQKAIKAADGSLEVTFNSDSKVTKNGQSQNVWGEISGKTDDVIYMFAHMDGYYHSDYDDALGAGVVLSMVKAIKKSGYEPEKTIRICFHGAEEWGKSGNEYDWSTGAYEQIETQHPEWVKDGFVILNIDGGYALEDETSYGTDTSYELKNFVKTSGTEVTELYKKLDWRFGAPTSTGTEDLKWQLCGIPAVVAGEGEECIYFNGAYHSNMDDIDVSGINEDALEATVGLYGKLLFDFDSVAVMPMDFTTTFKAVKKSLNNDVYTDEEFNKMLDEAIEVSGQLTEKINNANKDGLSDEAVAELNNELQSIYVEVNRAFLRVNFDPAVAIGHTVAMDDCVALDQTIAALEKGSVQEAYDEYLWAVDWSWYSMYFSKDTCDYFVKQLVNNREGTWGEGLLAHPHLDTDAVVRSLGAKYDDEEADVSKEITQLKKLRETSLGYAKASINEEKDALQDVIEDMKDLL